MSWKSKGAVGVVTSGGARDTDEIVKEKVPLYFKAPGRGIRPGRNEVESVNRPGDHMLARRLLGKHTRVLPAQAREPGFTLKML